MLKVQLLKFLHSKFSSSSGISHSSLFSCCCKQSASMPLYHFVFLLLCLPVQFLLQNVFRKLINIFVFFLVDAFGFPVFWFQKDREITKNHFTIAENNFGERKLSCTPLTFGEILFAQAKRAVSLQLARSAG